jgi:hypothetical protein
MAAAGAGASDSAILWLQEQLAGHSLTQLNLEPLGLRLAGSDVLTSAPGPAIQLVYTDDSGHAYRLLVGTERSGIELAISSAPEHYISLAWRRDPLVFLLVAPAGGSVRLDIIMRAASGILDSPPGAADAGPRT